MCVTKLEQLSCIVLVQSRQSFRRRSFYNAARQREALRRDRRRNSTKYHGQVAP
jgi:hypothetical protein